MEPIKEIDAAELKSRLDDQKDDLVLIDCRERDEWEHEHISQAILAPLSDFLRRIEELEKDNTVRAEQALVIHCRSGKRSMKACQMLAERGYRHLVNLEGGILGWRSEGLPTRSHNHGPGEH